MKQVRMTVNFSFDRMFSRQLSDSVQTILTVQLYGQLDYLYILRTINNIWL